MSPEPQDLFSGRPILTVGGTRRTDLEKDLLYLEVVEAPGQPFRCRARFANLGLSDSGRPGFTYFDEARPDLGAELVVEVNYRGANLRIFMGHLNVFAAHYPEGRKPEIELAAEDPLQRLRMHQRSRTLYERSDADIVAEIAAEYGFASELSLADEVHPVVVQLQQTDLDFVRERTRIGGGEIWFRDGRLIGRRRGESPHPAVDLKLGQELLSFEVRADLSDQATALRVQGWDYLHKQAAVGTAGAGPPLGGLAGEVDGGSVHQTAFGDRQVQAARSGPPSAAPAEMLARAYYGERASRFVRGHGSGSGLPQIWVGRQVTLSGAGELFDGGYEVVRVRHTFDLEEGYRTDLNVERQGLPLKPERRREQPDGTDGDED